MPHWQSFAIGRASPVDGFSFCRSTERGTRSPTPASTRCVRTQSIQRFENAVAGPFEIMGYQAEGFIEQKKPSRKCTSAWSQRCLQKGTGCELWNISAFKQAFVTCFEAALNSLLHLLTGDHEADHEIRKASKSRLTYEHPPVLDSLDISLLLLRSVILLPDEVSHTVTWTVWCCAPLCCGCPGRKTIALPNPFGRLDSSGPSTASQCIMLGVA